MNKLLVITGPTNVGKTDLAVNLAQKINAEIISADSRQVYQGMSIGTAKPTVPQIKKVRHYLIDVVGPDQPFSLANYQTLAYQAIDEVAAKGKKAMLVGGTGLYIQAIVDGLKIPKVPPNSDLRETLEGLTTEELRERLLKLDPDSVKAIPSTNRRRLIRSIEVSELTGEPFSILGRQYQRRFETLQIGLTAPREELYRRADLGVEQWLKMGWVEEVRKLKKNYPSNLPSMSSIGYRQIGMFLDGQITLEEAVRRVKYERHNYIRRQIMWFRRDRRIYWYDTTEPGWGQQLEKQVHSWYAENNG
jgi:tRNA dimethylallyltransferase